MESNAPAASASTTALFDVEPATERRCKRCGLVRPLSMFYIESEKRQSERMGHRWRGPCRLCQQKVNMARLASRRLVVDKIKIEAGCADCGHRNDEHPEVFDFDHLPGYVKSENIAKLMTNGTMEQILAEIEKCEVVCANCHRIRSRTRQSNKFGRDSGEQRVL